MKVDNYTNQKNIIFLSLFGVAFFMAFTPLKTLYESSFQREYYSHIVLIPLVSIYFLFQKRNVIFSMFGHSIGIGISILLVATFLYFAGQSYKAELNQNDFSSVIALAAVVFMNGAFILCYGLRAYRTALFPLLFLIFVIPIPSTIMEAFIYVLQVGSTEFTNLLFMASGVSFLRDGFIFHLPGVSVEVAKQCSGIRSSLALLITAILAGHMFLQTGWKKVFLALLIIPVTMFKNGIRILILTLLGTYVDPRWLTESSFHRDGGIVFFILALLLMSPVLYYLRRGERKVSRIK